MKHPNSIWLSTYHDGELHGERLLALEAHLALCATCRKELEMLRALSRAFQEVSPGPVRASPAEFKARVLGDLVEERGESPWGRVTRLAWQLSPLAFLLLWAFVQAVLAVVSLMGAFAPFEAGGSFLPPVLISLLSSAVLAVLVCSWLAAWWSYQRHQVLQPF
jgi:anti-sigma factor RsiW